MPGFLMSLQREKRIGKPCRSFAYGAGRNLSRTEHKKTFSETPVQEIFDAETKGLEVRFYKNKIDITELPSAYKDAASVRAQMSEFGFGKVIDEVIPYGSIMAGDLQKKYGLENETKKENGCNTS